LRSAKEEKRTAELKGDPQTVRDFLSVEDVVEAYIALIESGVPGETYNVASGRELSFREAAGILAKEIDCAYEVSPDPARIGGAMYSVGDFTKLNKATGWSPSKSVEQTLINMVHAQAH
jgi:GDP-4-dehydro-6-deoxy-D-mannose reductase